ncbi:MAG TPA: hypothetical protein VG122_12790 [Gemmata sp.]|jgi:hypothetical protein|nr:hypothetical protein [Gemmata sp.]
MPSFVAGLDLGQTADYSALVVLERSTIPDPERAGYFLNRFDVRHIHRWQLGTNYPQVVEELKEWYSTPMLRGTTLILDATGVGKAVADFVKKSGIMASVRPFTITAGFKEGDGTVPKKDLVAAVLTPLQTKRLWFAGELELRPVLEKELETFRVKVTPDRNETFAAWREKDHDDLVLALALAVWYGEKGHGILNEAQPEPGGRPDRDGLPRDTFGPPMPRDIFD